MDLQAILPYSAEDGVLFGRIRSGMKPPKACPYCEGTTELPHHTEADCFRAVDLDITAAAAHLRLLTKRKSQLLRVRILHRHRAIAARRRERL